MKINSSVSKTVISGRVLRFDYGGFDYHPTPSGAVEDILQREELIAPVWEPASGDGAISRVLEGLGHKIRSSDILTEDWIYGEKGVDFFTEECKVGTIITNPPYNRLTDFAIRSLQKAEKVILLIHAQALGGKARYETVYRPNPPKTVYQYTHPIPYWSEGVWRRGGAVTHCWVVWVKGYRGKTELRWIH